MYVAACAEVGMQAHHGSDSDELLALAAGGDIASQVRLGELCGWSSEGQADPERAVFWYTEAARNGSPEAMYCLSICYLYGYGVDPDLAVSRRWARECEDALNGSTPCA
jgi:TPR repeat protein